MFRPSVIFPILLAGAGLASQSCTSYPDGGGYYGDGTVYLGGLGGAPIARQPHVGGAPVLQDNVSFWDGDGVRGTPSITIDLSEQKAYFYKSGELVGVSQVSTGREGHNTPAGKFKVSEKDVDHRSNLYGDFVDGAGNVVVSDVAVKKDRPPPGTRFLGAPMYNFMRINGAIGMHAGYLPGYAASHGCIRMPEHMARKFYEHAHHGTPVTVTY